MSLLSSRKDAIKNRKNYLHNRPIKSKVRTYAKKIEAILAKHDFSEDEAKKAISIYESVAMKAAKRNIVNKIAVSRKISRLVMRVKNRMITTN